MDKPTYHVKQDNVNGGHILFVRHALPPHDVVGSISIPDTKTMRDIADFLVDIADADDIVSSIPRDELIAGPNT